jgi:hypothetical protein
MLATRSAGQNPRAKHHHLGPTLCDASFGVHLMNSLQRQQSPLHSAEVQRISKILQFPVIVERRRPLSREPQPF